MRTGVGASDKSVVRPIFSARANYQNNSSYAENATYVKPQQSDADESLNSSRGAQAVASSGDVFALLSNLAEMDIWADAFGKDALAQKVIGISLSPARSIRSPPA
jgi:hypothetical protein